MHDTLLAKSKNCETIEEHTLKCLQVFADIKLHYAHLLTAREWDILEHAVMFHDVGKIDLHMQNKLRIAAGLPSLEVRGIPFPHNVLSTAALNKTYFTKTLGWTPDEFTMLAKTVYYHHARIVGPTEEEKSAFADYIKNEFTARCSELDIQSHNGLTNRCKRGAIILDWVKMAHWKESDIRYILLKGMLNRIDYCASAGRTTAEDTAAAPMRDKMLSAMQKKGHQLRDVQTFLLQHQNENVIVQAATGIGKTEGACLWSGSQKTYYALPLKVSTDSIYERIIAEDGIDYQEASLLHGDAKAYYLEQSIENQPDEIADFSKWDAAKLFASPFTVCTIDQILRFVSKALGTEPGAAALAGNCLIIDEIQMYSPELIAKILYALKLITQLGGKFLIMTATMPKVILDFIQEMNIPCLIEPHVFHAPVTKRHRIQLLQQSEFPYEQITEKGRTNRVLVICNTIKQAQTIYQNLSATSSVDVHLLHSRFIKKDRTELEKAILNFAPNDDTRQTAAGIWVTTQIVEASLDIDFDYLFTSLCSIDSLLQRMGRIYRSRWYDLNDEPNCYVVDNKDGYGLVVDKELYQFSLNAISAFNDQLLEESDNCDHKQQMMNLVFDATLNPALKQSGKGYYHRIKTTLDKLENLSLYQQEKAESAFRDINNVTVIPENIYTELVKSGKVQQWATLFQSKNKLNKLMVKQEILSYTTQVRRESQMPLRGEAFITFWPHSGIWIYAGDYEFNMNSLSGKGLSKTKTNSNYRKMDEGVFL